MAARFRAVLAGAVTVWVSEATVLPKEARMLADGKCLQGIPEIRRKLEAALPGLESLLTPKAHFPK